MDGRNIISRPSPGFTMIEVLVSLVIIAFGLLGLAGLQTRMQQAEFESYQRAQALVLLYDMVDRINSHRATAPCFAVTTNMLNGTSYYGTDSLAMPTCGYSTSGNNAMADNSMSEWDNLLKGAAELKGGTGVASYVGAMVGARGCVNYDNTTLLPDPTGASLTGTGIYTVAVAWQGNSDTIVPTVNCANTLYGPETRRRVVSTTFRMAYLK